MITKLSYVCEYCGREYKNEPACIKCEESHQQVAKVKPHYGKGAPYPRTIDVVFPDGRVDKYLRIFTLARKEEAER